MASRGQRRDSKHRLLHNGESIRANGKYQFKYLVDGKPKFVYSWRLVPTDPQPIGKQPCLSLRELEKLVGKDVDSRLDITGRNITVNELISRYLKTRTGVRHNTLSNYNFVQNIMSKEEFGSRKIGEIKTSDAKLFLIKLQEDGRGSSTIKTVRGVLRPAFQMAVDSSEQAHVQTLHQGESRHEYRDQNVPLLAQIHHPAPFDGEVRPNQPPHLPLQHIS